jgi:hypothetical protein
VVGCRTLEFVCFPGMFDYLGTRFRKRKKTYEEEKAED